MRAVLAALVMVVTAGKPAVAPALPCVVTSFGPITSHNGALRGEVVEAPRAISGGGGVDRWIVRLERSSGQRVENAQVETVTSTPATPESNSQRGSAMYIGGGHYEIPATGFDQPGWWNLDLVVRYGGRADSLAFNVIIPRRD